MLFGPWSSKKPIPISTCLYEDFKEMLTFLYTGNCELSTENVVALVDLAQSYELESLKTHCDNFLMATEVTAENALKYLEYAQRYSLQQTSERILEFIKTNTEDVIKSYSFVNVSKEILIDIAKMEHFTVKEEEFFEAIKIWGKQNCIEFQQTSGNFEAAFKHVIKDILPFIRFPIMSLEYLHHNIVPMGYLFTYDELSKILIDAAAFSQHGIAPPPVSAYSNKYRGRRILLTDKNGNEANVYVFDKHIFNGMKIYNGMQSRATYNNASEWGPWNQQQINTKSSINTIENVKYYLVKNYNGYLALKPKTSICSGECILAPVIPSNNNFSCGSGSTMLKVL
uniref:BACK domain-containing protein n=1 Tax=Panagrolaimus davidi TaxID=227884 RepID=A0A914QA96_9BILA